MIGGRRDCENSHTVVERLEHLMVAILATGDRHDDVIGGVALGCLALGIDDDPLKFYLPGIPVDGGARIERRAGATDTGLVKDEVRLGVGIKAAGAEFHCSAAPSARSRAAAPLARSMAR